MVLTLKETLIDRVRLKNRFDEFLPEDLVEILKEQIKWKKFLFERILKTKNCEFTNILICFFNILQLQSAVHAELSKYHVNLSSKNS